MSTADFQMEEHCELIVSAYVLGKETIIKTDGTCGVVGRIVRCKDCKRFAVDQSDHEYRSGWWCHRWNTDMVKPDGFCAWGVKK